MLTHLSLFSGIGGIDLAAEWAGFKTIAFVENNGYCQKVLQKHWPDVPIIEDVKDVTREKIMAYTEPTRLQGHAEQQAESADTPNGCNKEITLISGGFPCQPHSVAGLRKGADDERNLWPEFRRIVSEVRPGWVMAENVPGLFSTDAGRFFGEVVTNLAALGYAVGWSCYGAVDVGALHRRNRVFIVGYAESDRGNPRQDNGRERRNLESEAGRGESIDAAPEPGSQDVADTERDTIGAGLCETEPAGEWRQRPSNGSWWAVEPDVGRVVNGVPSRVDRLRCLGNAVVPQQVYPILQGIADIKNRK